MVSPVMVGAEAASPQPTVPSRASMRTRILRAWVTVSAAILTGLVSGSATGIASTRRMVSGARARSEGRSEAICMFGPWFDEARNL